VSAALVSSLFIPVAALTAATARFASLSPLAMDVVELPHLNKFADFLYIGRPNIRRVVYELHPDSIGDRRGYDEFCNYLIEGRNAVARAGVAREMEKHGYKIFILPPGQAARALGYKGTQMIACVRSR
jgi:hypothetical protein